METNLKEKKQKKVAAESPPILIGKPEGQKEIDYLLNSQCSQTLQ